MNGMRILEKCELKTVDRIDEDKDDYVNIFSKSEINVLHIFACGASSCKLSDYV